MNRYLIASMALLATAWGQNLASAQDSAHAGKMPVCSAGSVCFSGEVSAGDKFRKSVNGQLDFVLEPQDSGWNIQIVPSQVEPDCDEFATVVTQPYRSHSDLNLDMSYGVTAEEEVANSPRIFSFVTNCKDLRAESDRLQKILWPYSYSQAEVDKALADLGSSPLGKCRMWITDARISHASDTTENKQGVIEQISFVIEIRLPAQSTSKRH